MPISVAARESLIESFRNKIAWFLAFACRPPSSPSPFQQLFVIVFLSSPDSLLKLLKELRKIKFQTFSVDACQERHT